MFGDDQKASGSGGSEEKSAVKKVFTFSWIIVIIAALVVGGIFYSRWQQEKDYEAKAAEQKREQARKIAESFGGSSFEILNFYASPGAIQRGDTVQVCYGVSNAKTVDITPKLPEATWVSLNRCIPVEPKKTTTYTLTAVDASGQKKSATLTVEVQ
ncbi:MAG TPA: hypothetical protein VKB26_12665 [Candidatus Acidoferrales bacterium]|nr:hypothetical protein [Candidatus Acidoferrales bacterium]